MSNFISRNEAEKALSEGKRVKFHWNGLSVEIDKLTTLNDLRWLLREKKAMFYLTVNDVVNGKYSIINK
ncbi:hypothetical protein [Ureibacillus thermosphaericus]|uniref:Uncharacterized protein n=1 Tax=Ureibacillus thermosphaericus TaxID=51173 RepID=A0A840PV72_URETH|nr:hypothetical protein [Ureibacillus thermosphaericus]MBB5148631.1 hypothetical protein [Ureibacillus thermosphaericus]NKZ31346.1 hypothetical protein [Ureibacillus thermosphaericus]